jgi:ABC-type enterochelin transport system permease subunit
MLNQERLLTIGKIIMVWFLGFACGAPFMNLILNIRYHSSVVIPLVNLVVMAAISGIGLFLLMRHTKG